MSTTVCLHVDKHRLYINTLDCTVQVHRHLIEKAVSRGDGNAVNSGEVVLLDQITNVVLLLCVEVQHTLHCWQCGCATHNRGGTCGRIDDVRYALYYSHIC